MDCHYVIEGVKQWMEKDWRFKKNKQTSDVRAVLVIVLVLAL